MQTRLSRKYRTRLIQSTMFALLLIDARSVAAEASLKATLQARYSAIKAAMTAHDGSAISAFLAPDFTSVEVSGESHTASQMIAEVNSLKPDANKVSETTLTSVSLVDNQVRVEQTYSMKTVKTGADGVAHPVKIISSSTDTWVKSGDVWLLQRTVTNEMSLFKDDRLVAHRVKPSRCRPRRALIFARPPMAKSGVPRAR